MFSQFIVLHKYNRIPPFAALDNNIDRLRDHIARGETNRRDNFGYTALHYAARQRHADACRLLLAAGADANTQTTAGAVTALHRAASAGGAEIVRMLLAHGARVQMTDDDGNTALHRAAAAGHVDICVMLCSRDQGAVSTMKVLKNKRGQRAADLVRADRRSDLQSVFDFAIAEAEVAE